MGNIGREVCMGFGFRGDSERQLKSRYFLSFFFSCTSLNNPNKR